MTKNKGKALKRKTQPLPVQSDTEKTTRDEDEHSPRHMMNNMGALLSTVTTKMGVFKKGKNIERVQSFPMQFTLPLLVPQPAMIQISRLPPG